MRSEPASQSLAIPEQALRQFQVGMRRFAQWRQQSLGIKGTLPYWLAVPTVFATLIFATTGDMSGLLSGIAATGLVLAAGKLNRMALLENKLHAERTFTHRRSWPAQPLAILAFAGFTGIAAWGMAGHNEMSALILAVMGGLGMMLTYPLSPYRRKRRQAKDKLRPDQLETLKEAEKQLLQLRRLAEYIGQAELASRLDSIADRGSQILAELAEHPELLVRSRRFLHVHLEGAERVASSYAKLHRFQRQGALETRFRETLLMIEHAFIKHLHDLADERTEPLNIRIAVLQKQLRHI